MKFLAHISEDGKRVQTVKEHSENVTNLAYNNAKSIGLSPIYRCIN